MVTLHAFAFGVKRPNMSKSIAISFMLFFSLVSYAMSPKKNMTPQELFKNASAVVIFQIESGNYKHEWGPDFILSGKVVRVLKGKPIDKITINDSDDTVTECFGRELGAEYIAFLDKTASNSYHSLWARDSVFQVHGFEDDWEPSVCHSEEKPYSSCDEHKGHKHGNESNCIRPLPINERMSGILNYALNKASKNDAE